MSNVDFVIPRRLLILGEDLRGRNRWAVEQARLANAFPQFRWAASGNTYQVHGKLTTNLRRQYAIYVALPSDYPHRLPKIFPNGWAIESCPHAYVEGNMCIMRPDQWRPIYSVAVAVAKAAIWLNKYEVYRHNGYWPGTEQGH
ncbi:hypothetical protein ACFQY4_16935 [Catellatospora bangladeshensis]|uniref:Type II CBASS E2 protein domain-containing protein n=1 Tax=Catellatospora bangladeshensis TaxID=310355 RepID=A0A8J3NKA0_9ACTN|nr:hypothetical protein [Catellatospora bangladeshensis]GIF84205.1 hypothetical protein Cba03nite_55540 [Catellatospora bangladeshensis]